MSARMWLVPKKTAVWWDLSSCPIPVGYDPRCIRPSIESALKKSSGYDFGVDHQVTIYVFGNLWRITRDDLKALSSSGIHMRHTDFGLKGFCYQLLCWQSENPPPATVMLISNYPHGDMLYHSTLDDGVSYNNIPAYQRPDGSNPWTWDTILNESPVLKTPPSPSHFALNDNCPRWICIKCEFECNEYQTFAHHLYGVDHDKELYDATHFPPTNLQVEISQEFLKHKALARVPLRQVKKNRSSNSNLPAGPSVFSKKDASKAKVESQEGRRREKQVGPSKFPHKIWVKVTPQEGNSTRYG